MAITCSYVARQFTIQLAIAVFIQDTSSSSLSFGMSMAYFL